MRIEPGTTYVREVYLGDDGLYEWVVCVACKELGPEVSAWLWDPWEGYTTEDYIEWAQENQATNEGAAAFLQRRAKYCARAAMGGA